MIDLFFKVAPWLIIIPLVLSLYHFKILSEELKIITYYLIVSTLTQIIAFTLWILSKNNFPVVHVYTLLEFSLLTLFYYLLMKDIVTKKMFLLIVAAFTIYSVVNSLFIQGLFHMNTYASALRSLLMICFSLTFLFTDINRDDKDKTYFSPAVNWINYGLLIYFSGALFLFSFVHFSPTDLHSQINIWAVHSLLLGVLYIFLTIGIWKVRRI